MMPSEVLNLTVCVLVWLTGFYWLQHFDDKYGDDRRFVFGAYVCWWLSWLVWIGAWASIVLRWEEYAPSILSPLILAGSDLNAILLIILYLFLTRGNDYRPKRALIHFVFFFSLFSVGYGIFYIFLPFDIALNLQKGWSLCLGTGSTILVGWAFALRYNTKVVLAVGFIYAFTQPALFEAVLDETDAKTAVALTLQAVTVSVAILKVIWASVVTLYFLERPVTTESLVRPNASVRVPEELSWPWLIQTALLLVVTVILAIRAVQSSFQDLIPVLTALGSIVVLLTGLIKAVQWLSKRTGVTKPNANLGGVDEPGRPSR